jgi:hypothetical protein
MIELSVATHGHEPSNRSKSGLDAGPGWPLPTATFPNTPFVVPPPPSPHHPLPSTRSGRHAVSSSSSPPCDLASCGRCGREWNRAVAGGDDRIRRGRRIRLSTQHRPHAAGAVDFGRAPVTPGQGDVGIIPMLLFRSLFCVWFVSLVKLVFLVL